MGEEPNPFESPRLLLAGAERHIQTFRTKLEELRAGPWATPVATGNRGEAIIEADVTVPTDMKQIVFDIANNLRSALDHAVYASTFQLTGRDLDKTKFPFGDTEKDLRDDAKRRCRDVPSEVTTFLLSFAPHRTGNPLLYGLNKLRNTKSHRVLIPCAAQTHLSGIGQPSEGASQSYEWDPATSRFKTRLELAPGVQLGAVMFSFRLELLIGTGTFRGEPTLSLFDRLLCEVDRIVSAIEAETARILRERER